MLTFTKQTLNGKAHFLCIDLCKLIDRKQL